VVTAAAALPVLLALLPDAAPLRYSAPAPLGLPGGYPVEIAAGAIRLDLPPGADLDEIVAYHRRMGRGDGVEEIAEDGTVFFTEAAKAAVADLDPGLGEPLSPDDALARFERLASHLNC
jgi:streptogramin lyase